MAIAMSLVDRGRVWIEDVEGYAVRETMIAVFGSCQMSLQRLRKG
jgi:hypothetical protein